MSMRIGFLVLVSCAAAPLAAFGAEAQGQKVFEQCAACHSTDGSAGVGPTLKGIVGRESGSVPGFPYSSALKRAKLQWTQQQLDRYIADPQAAVPGNAMPYAGMPNAADRAALIAYLAALK